MKRPNMLGFYRKDCFMDCVEVWRWLFVGGGSVFSQVVCARLGFSKFVDCKGGGGGDGICGRWIGGVSGLIGNSLVWAAVGD